MDKQCILDTWTSVGSIIPPHDRVGMPSTNDMPDYPNLRIPKRAICKVWERGYRDLSPPGGPAVGKTAVDTRRVPAGTAVRYTYTVPALNLRRFGSARDFISSLLRARVLDRWHITAVS